MKYLIALAFIASCSSNRDVPVGPQPDPVAGAPFEEVSKTWGLKDCKEYYRFKYCMKPEKGVVVFENEQLRETIRPSGKGLNFTVQVETLGTAPDKAKKIFITPGTQEKDWSGLYPSIKAVLTSNGYHVVNTAKESDLTVSASYGFLNKSSKVSFKKWGDKSTAQTQNSNTRYLELTEKKSGWSVISRSTGYLSDMKAVIPVLASTLADSLDYEPNTTINGELKDSDLSVVAFKDYTKR